MTNKNKKSKRLVSASKTIPFPEFELIPTLTERAHDPDSVTEVDIDTSALDSDCASPADRTQQRLDDLVRRKTRQVKELEYRLEHALSRRRGLEKELQVREEITAAVNADVRQARAQLTDAARELESLHARHRDLQQEFAETDVLAGKLGEQVARQRSDAAAREHELERVRDELHSSRAELADLHAYIDGRSGEWDDRRKELDELRRALADATDVRQALERQIAAGEAEHDAVRSALADTQTAMASLEKDALRLGEENRELQKTLHRDVDRELRRYRDRVTRQSGELAARAQQLKRLGEDSRQLEVYADTLRIRLQEQTLACRESQLARDELVGSLEAANDRIDDLAARLDRSRTAVQALTDEKARLKEAYERELRQIRFELENAQETIAGQETVNESLVSDLADNQGFRLALESHLGKLEEDSRRRIRTLTRELKDAREAAANYERKIRHKDAAIADLMNEIAERRETMEISRDLENALQKIDGFRAEAKPVRRRGERDHRVARMLVGEADGKELRFPLFRNRLTIGRTPHNDIQLNMRYISRRHAVIASDDNGTRIIDWGSRNGVYVNRKRVTEKILASGDVITIGLTQLRFQEKRRSRVASRRPVTGA